MIRVWPVRVSKSLKTTELKTMLGPTFISDTLIGFYTSIIRTTALKTMFGPTFSSDTLISSHMILRKHFKDHSIEEKTWPYIQLLYTHKHSYDSTLALKRPLY